MKRICIAAALSLVMVIMPTKRSEAVVWVVIQQALIKVIKAIDLQVQRLQNKTIWLQNAQKTVENTMSKLQLDEITDWVQKQKDQYAKYFDELHKVKEAISGYNKIKEIIDKQSMLVKEYKWAYELFKKDTHFNLQEINYMYRVYTGIIDESVKSLDQLFLVTTDLITQVTDGGRLKIMNIVAQNIDENLNDLRSFNQQNAKLSLQRSKDYREIAVVKKMYGIE